MKEPKRSASGVSADDKNTTASHGVWAAGLARASLLVLVLLLRRYYSCLLILFLAIFIIRSMRNSRRLRSYPVSVVTLLFLSVSAQASRVSFDTQSYSFPLMGGGHGESAVLNSNQNVENM